MKSSTITILVVVVVIIACIITLGVVYGSKSNFLRPTNIEEALLILRNENLYCPIAPQKDQVISFRWDGAGFNNMRMAVEIIFGIALIYGRTIVLPPAGKWAHLKSGSKLEDFYDMDALTTAFPTITADEYFDKQDVTYEEYSEYFKEHDKLNLTKKYEALKSNWKDFNKEYGKNKGNIWHFGIRMYSSSDDYFRDTEHAEIVRLKLYQGFRFPEEMLHKVAQKLAFRGIKEPGSYNAIHYRAGDWKTFRPKYFKVTKSDYIKRLKKLLGKDAKLPLLIITNEKDPKELKWFREISPKIIIVSNINESEKDALIIDILLCVCSKHFIGTQESSMTYYIQILHGFLSNKLPGTVSGKPLYLQKEGQDNVRKEGEKYRCGKGCWHIMDTMRWESVKDA